MLSFKQTAPEELNSKFSKVQSRKVQIDITNAKLQSPTGERGTSANRVVGLGLSGDSRVLGTPLSSGVPGCSICGDRLVEQ